MTFQITEVTKVGPLYLGIYEHLERLTFLFIKLVTRGSEIGVGPVDVNPTGDIVRVCVTVTKHSDTSLPLTVITVTTVTTLTVTGFHHLWVVGVDTTTSV